MLPFVHYLYLKCVNFSSFKKMLYIMGRGGSLVVSVLTHDTDDPSSNLAEYDKFSENIVFEKNKKRSRMAHF